MRSPDFDQDLTPWTDPGFFRREEPVRSVFRLIWQQFRPPRGHRLVPTFSGFVLLTMGIALVVAAYTTANNIIFLCLALMAATFTVGAALAFWNFQGLRWRISGPPALRVGEAASLFLEVANDKRMIPTHAVLAHLKMPGADLPTLSLPSRLGPGETMSLPFVCTPLKRGLLEVELRELTTEFPFGFLRKTVAGNSRREFIVWPGRLPYQFNRARRALSLSGGQRTRRRGAGAELLQLRAYRAGDSPRMLHWKASARVGTLLVRENAEDTRERYALWFDPAAATWTRPADFEQACRFAATLAEDLFRAGNLTGAAVGGGPVRPFRRVSDLALFFDDLARVMPATPPPPAPFFAGSPTLLRFGPGPGGSITLYADEQPAGSA